MTMPMTRAAKTLTMMDDNGDTQYDENDEHAKCDADDADDDVKMTLLTLMTSRLRRGGPNDEVMKVMTAMKMILTMY